MARTPARDKGKRRKAKRTGSRVTRSPARTRPEGWNAADGRVWIERNSRRRITAIWHPTHPFVHPTKALDDIAALLPAANSYLASVKDLLELPDWWLADLKGTPTEQSMRIRLGWLREPDTDPRYSFWSRREGEDEVVDRTAVLIAGLTAGLPEQNHPLFGGQGLRVVAHVGRGAIRITGVSSSLPS